MSGPKRQLQCAVCGSDAGRWHQHWNRDTGFGICRLCTDWILHQRRMDPTEFRRTYGVAGVNYEPKMVRHMGRDFIVLAEFPETEDAQANAYMDRYPGAAVLGIWDGKVILADVNDLGQPAKEVGNC